MVSAGICLLQQLPNQAPLACALLEEQSAASWVAEQQVAVAEQPSGSHTHLKLNGRLHNWVMRARQRWGLSSPEGQQQ